MTDWQLIRKLVNTAIDTCEGIENSGVDETHRSLAVNESVLLNDYLMSAWVAPENLTRKVICKSAAVGQPKPYTDELARTMLAIGALCSELVKQTNIEHTPPTDELGPKSIKEDVNDLCDWYTHFCLPSIETTMNAKNTNT